MSFGYKEKYKILNLPVYVLANSGRILNGWMVNWAGWGGELTVNLTPFGFEAMRMNVTYSEH